MNIVAASITGLESNRAVLADEFVRVPGLATDGLQLRHQASLPGDADMIEVPSNRLRAPAAWSVHTDRLASADLSVRSATEANPVIALSFGDRATGDMADESGPMTLWSIGDDHGAGSVLHVSGHTLQ